MPARSNAITKGEEAAVPVEWRRSVSLDGTSWRKKKRRARSDALERRSVLETKRLEKKRRAPTYHSDDEDSEDVEEEDSVKDSLDGLGHL